MLVALVIAAFLADTGIAQLDAAAGSSGYNSQGTATIRAEPSRAAPARVLALYWYGKDYPSNAVFDRELKAAFERDSAGPIEYYSEYFESSRFPGREQALILRDYLREKYEGHVDVVLAVSPVPLNFLLDYRADLFSSTPLVFYTSAGLQVPAATRGTVLTGVSAPDAYASTLRLALDLHPAATKVFVVSGTPARDGLIEDEVRQQLMGFDGRVDVMYLTDLRLDALIDTLSTVPQGSVILYARQSHDEPGSTLTPIDFLRLIAPTAAAPIYSPGGSYIGNGSVGGHVVDLAAGAAKAAEIALKVARGADPEDVPMAIAPTVAFFDARELKRWGIDDDRLPAGSIVAYREPTLWGQYGKYIAGAAILFLMQAVLIGALLAQRARRREAETFLKRSEERYELATAAARVAVWDLNLETNEMYVDPSLPRVLGYTDGDTGAGWAQHVHLDDVDRVLREARSHMDSESSYDTELRMTHRDGSIRWFHLQASPVRRPGARAARFIGTHTDITERKLAEIDLAEARSELARVSRLTALGEFAASIAHEINQPLTAILLDAKTCLRWIETGCLPIDCMRDALSDIVEAGTRASELIRRNRELFRNHTVEKLPLAVDALVRDVTSMVATQLVGHQVKLEIAVEKRLPTILGDRMELQQVLLNLIINGIDAMAAVDPALRKLRIDARLALPSTVQIDVRDSGVGLADVDLERIFQPAYTTKPTGTGVGLSISRSIVEAHGGRLWARSNEGPGATFCFTIPIVEAASGPPERSSSVTRRHRKPATLP